MSDMPVTLGPAEGSGRMMKFYAYRQDDAEPVGFFYLRPDHRPPSSARVGFKVAPRERGKGLGAEIFKLGIQLAFETYNMERIWIGYQTARASSRAAVHIAERCGFTGCDAPPTLGALELRPADYINNRRTA